MEYRFNSEGRKIQLEFSGFIERCTEYFSSFDFLRDSESALREMKENIVRPFNVAVFGRMKTGKSTLINALIGKHLVITGVNEATATINVISYTSNPESLNKFKVHWKNEVPSEFPLEDLYKDWTGKTDDVLDRVKRTLFLQLYSDSSLLGLHEIIDTPGTGSVSKEHEDVAQRFMNASESIGRNADALIYVFPPVARETDEESLEVFRKDRLENSTPYNSVAVLHKWDEILYNEYSFDDINKKAGHIYSLMSDMVADVIPFSGPLAFVGENAPETLFEELVVLCRQGFDNLRHLLSRNEKWDRDPNRLHLRKAFNMPWASFRLMVKIISEKRIDSSLEARRTIVDISGIKKLRDFIDKNFFKRSEMIRQNQIIAKIGLIKQKYDEEFSTKISLIEREVEYFEKLLKIEITGVLRDWVYQKYNESKLLMETLNSKAVIFDEFFINSEIKKKIDDFNMLEILVQSNLLSKEDLNIVNKIIAHLGGDDILELPSQQEIDDIDRKIAHIPRRIKTRRVLDYLQHRIANYRTKYSKWGE